MFGAIALNIDLNRSLEAGRQRGQFSALNGHLLIYSVD
jgi:hypothetical protein